MRRIPLIQPARNWQEWWYDTGFAILIVAVVWGFTGKIYGILAAVGVGVQAGAAIRLRPRSGARPAPRSDDPPDGSGDSRDG